MGDPTWVPLFPGNVRLSVLRRAARIVLVAVVAVAAATLLG